MKNVLIGGLFGAMSEKGPEHEDGQGRKLRVVVVDDSPAALTAMAQLVASLGCTTLAGVAKDGPSGLGMALRLRPDLVITDVTMPGFDGFHLVRCLRQELPLVRSLVTSANNGAAWLRVSKAHGADGFIPKEKLAEDLPGVIAAFLEKERDERLHERDHR